MNEPSLQFGLALLEPLPVMLNALQDLTSGTSGLEQRNTPDGVGQQIRVPSDRGATGRRERKR